jgi:hypothetical protein
VFNLHFSTENDNNFGYEKITIVVDNMPLSKPLEIYIQGLEPRKADQVLFQVLPLA